MPIQTDLSISPYFDDFSAEKDYYKILFRPDVAVQVRELNQLQTMLQKQVERFGDNIFRRGTIIDGCDIKFYDLFPYIKIKDNEADGAPANPTQYRGYYIRNSANIAPLIASVTTTVDGFESRSPDLNTLYLRYINSGYANVAGVRTEQLTFAADETLTVYNPSSVIEKIISFNDSTGFANTDEVVILSSLALQNSSGGTFFANGFFVGDELRSATANVRIVAVDSTTNTQVLILRVKPLTSDLQSGNTAKWTITTNTNVQTANVANSSVANVVSILGSGAQASLKTGTFGEVDIISVTGKGSGYISLPTVSIKTSTANTQQIEAANLVAQSFLTQIVVSNTSTVPVGTGYAMSVGEGVVYQKGFFARVEPQLVVVEKYANTPDAISVGFTTTETIVNSQQDQSLLDNVTGAPNATAPGANRLKLTPVLTVKDKAAADADPEFMSISEFRAGEPYKQNRQTVYNIIGNEMARRTFEESGNYVIDQFQLNTKSPVNFGVEATSFDILVDPGVALINGNRVATERNYQLAIDKGTDTFVANNATISLNYGNYVRVKQFGGDELFGELVDLYGIAANYITSAAGTVPSSAGLGTSLGTARVRTMIHETGTPGTADAIYRVYLFDVKLSTGANFSDVRSMFYSSGGIQVVADLVLTGGKAVLVDNNKTSLLYFAGSPAVKAISNVSYEYRTSSTQSLLANGTITLSTTSPISLPYTGLLSSEQERQILVIPTAAVRLAANTAGSVTTLTTSPTVTGVSTSFISDYVAGDFIRVANSTVNSVSQILSISNNTSLTLTANAATAFSGANATVQFPRHVPISLERASRTVTVTTANSTTMNMVINLGATVNAVTNMTVVHNVKSVGAQSQAKTVNRNRYVRVLTSNAVSLAAGPWALGVSDVFRLKKVYSANSASQVLSINAQTAVNSAADFITVTNNPFSNGDTVTYSNTGGTGAIGGLTNATSYFVIDANTSGFALSTSSGGAKIDITANSSTTHTFTGRPLHFTPTTYGVSDVTKNYYIDHNQTEDYYGTSYLYVKPAAANKPTITQGLLVQYDAFTVAGEGLKTIGSYSINDGLALAVSNTSINTMEIPEVYGTKGTYYDLRDHFDFRPVSANTVALITTANSSVPINPTEPSAVNRFSVANKLYPAPDTNLSADIEYYQGRADRVIINDQGEFKIMRGAPGSAVAPTKPDNALTINLLQIPPYPSLPFALSASMADFVDTSIANERFTNKRGSVYKVQTPIDSNQRARLQPRGYTMVDIGALDRRINALEYYVSFTLVEVLAQRRVIPSSTDPSVDRFKFGLFVDGFQDEKYSDKRNPGYSAAIINGYLSASVEEINLPAELDSADPLQLPYDELVFVSQTTCTNGPARTANTTFTGNTTVTSNTATTQVTQITTSVDINNRTTNRSNTAPYVYEDWAFKLSSLSGPAELYMNCFDNNTALEVLQSTTEDGNFVVIYNTATSGPVRAVTVAESRPTGRAYRIGGRRTLQDLGQLNIAGYGPGGGFISDSYVIPWTHNPSNGLFYKIRVYKGLRGVDRGADAPLGTYSFRLYYPTDAAVTEPRVIGSEYDVTTWFDGIIYNGIVLPYNLISQPSRSVRYIANDVYRYITGSGQRGAEGYTSLQQRFTVSITGLKPSTTHIIRMDGLDITAKTQAGANAVGAPLVTATDGTLVFDLFFYPDINNPTSEAQLAAQIASTPVGDREFTVTNSDGSSTSTGRLTIAGWVRQEINTPPVQPELPVVTSPTGIYIDTPTVTSVGDTSFRWDGNVGGGPVRSDSVNDF
jgi:hypothetical protein